MGCKETMVAVSNGSGGEGEGGSETKVCVWRVAGSGGGGGLRVQDGGRGGEQRENTECDCCD